MNHFLERNKEIFAFFRVIRGLILLSRTDVKIAEKEVEFGETSSEILVSNEESPESKKDLAMIGVWHFECAVELFEKAIRNLWRELSILCAGCNCRLSRWKIMRLIVTKGG